MTGVFLADAQPEERSALHLLLTGLNLEVIGQAATWEATLAQLPTTEAELLLVDWDLLPTPATLALATLRQACRIPPTVVLISRLDAHRHAAVASGADLFISKTENAERLAQSVQTAAQALRVTSARS